jgi:uncharacterized protein (DUF305 family)
MTLINRQHTAYLVTGSLLLGLVFGAGLWHGLSNRLTQLDNTPQQVTQPNSVDVGFSQSMIIHHDQAVTIANLVLGRSSNTIDMLAKSIIWTQLQEIGQMKGWLGAWSKPVSPRGQVMDWVENAPNVKDFQDLLFVVQCKSRKGAMAGLLTVDETNALRDLSDKALEKAFLHAMIAHHEAAIPMARFAANNGNSMLVKGLARSIIREQQTEIAFMKKLLEAMP